MADVNRKTVDYLVLHHAVTPTWEDKSRDYLINWFSDNGYARAYGSNPSNWSGLLKPNGQRSYAQAQFAGQRVTSATPDATDYEKKVGFRLVQLVQDVFGSICWHAGNWDINTRSIGIECLGDYRYMSLRENDCKVIADFWRSYDQSMGGKTSIVGHNEVSDSATSCPATILDSRNRIVELINAPNSGWAPEPVITFFDESVVTHIPYDTTTVDEPTIKKDVQVIKQVGVNGTRTVVTRITKSDDKETSRSIISDVTVPPITLVMGIGSLEDTPIIVPKPEDEYEPISDIPEPSLPDVIESDTSIITKLILSLIALIKRIFKL